MRWYVNLCCAADWRKVIGVSMMCQNGNFSSTFGRVSFGYGDAGGQTDTLPDAEFCQESAGANYIARSPLVSELFTENRQAAVSGSWEL